MKKIIDVSIVTEHNTTFFKRKLKDKIDEIQSYGYEVEVKYSTSTYASYNTEYSALVLTIEE